MQYNKRRLGGVLMVEQRGFTLDDGTGLRVVSARFLSESKFDRDLFRGYDTLRVLTYSASIPAIVKMLDDFEFDRFECVFGCESTLRDIRDILAFQQVAIGDTRAAIMNLRDDRHAYILGKVREGQARFRVLCKRIAHAKLYLLENTACGSTRVIMGSANLSEVAFSGRQPETLVSFDDDPAAWAHYLRMYEQIRDSASDEIELPPERIIKAEINIEETPVISDGSSTLVIDQTPAEELRVTIPVQAERIEKVAAALGPRISAAIPAFSQRQQRITPEVKRVISRIRLVKSADEADHSYFSINRPEGVAALSGAPFPLEWDSDAVAADARLLTQYFANYADAFEGNVARLQQDYFALWSWLYFSPFMCDLRRLALIQNEDVIRYPSFAIAFGKSNCGKSSIIDTLMTSMFGKVNTVDKRSFTSARLRGLQQAYRRLPVVFDDIGRTAFRNHGLDIIKDELPPPVEEYPGFILSMNSNDPASFPDEIVKRSMLIYTTTALPPHKEELRQRLNAGVQEIRKSLTGHLYRRYLAETMAQLADDQLPTDWLSLSSGVISGIIADSIDQPAPHWLRQATWMDYAEKRYDRIKARLNDLLRPSAMLKSEGDAPAGWTLDGDRVIVQEQRDAFGRRGFDWDDVPSTLIDDDASSGGRTALHRQSLEEFLGRSLLPRSRWTFWRR